jgi:Zn-dependent protease
VTGSKIRLFKLLGITFQIDPTWMVVFTLMSLSLASQFSKEYPHWSSIHYWSAGIVTCLLFFTSIIFHELAHSLVAKTAGLSVQSITVFILGGISQIGKEVQRPGVEFLVAAAGPTASIALSIVFGLVWVASRAHWETVGALAEWLMQINLLLALFNLIPSFPLDGGRILRSVLWGVSGSFSKATRIASLVGKVSASLFFVSAVALLLGGYVVYGLWVLFIGWFLWLASRQTERQLRFRDSFKGVKAADLMVTHCSRVETGSSLAKIEEQFRTDSGSPCFLVLEHGSLRGLIGRERLKPVSSERWRSTLVDEIMIPLSLLRWVRPNEGILGILEMMDREDIAYVPVLENGCLIGVLPRQEIFNLLRKRFHAIA